MTISDLKAWIRISDPGSEILGSGSLGSIDKLRFVMIYFCASSIYLVSNLKHYQSWFQSKDLFEACLRSCSADFLGGLCVLQSVSWHCLNSKLLVCHKCGKDQTTWGVHKKHTQWCGLVFHEEPLRYAAEWHPSLSGFQLRHMVPSQLLLLAWAGHGGRSRNWMSNSFAHYLN